MTPPQDRMPDREAARAIAAGASDEPLVPASLSPVWSIWPTYSRWGVPGAVGEIYLREGVFERLLQVAERLPGGMRLVLLDGWRPARVQQYLYDALAEKVEALHPDTNLEERHRVIARFASPPEDDPVQPSPHLTGGSVDLTLSDADGRLLDMGSAFDEPSERSHTYHYDRGEYAQRRKQLLNAMCKAGFTNLPSEWWHFDYGNWLWAWYRGKGRALYGPTSARSRDDLWNDVSIDLAQG